VYYQCAYADTSLQSLRARPNGGLERPDGGPDRMSTPPCNNYDTAPLAVVKAASDWNSATLSVVTECTSAIVPALTQCRSAAVPAGHSSMLQVDSFPILQVAAVNLWRPIHLPTSEVLVSCNIVFFGNFHRMKGVGRGYNECARIWSIDIS
jgi:hypothetical protein